MARRIARRITRLLFRLSGIRISALGLDRLPQSPHILVLNHSSFLDGIVLSALLPASPGYTFTARRELHRQRLLCPLVNKVNTLMLLPAGAPPSANIELMKGALRRGESLILFPEGRYKREPGLLRFHSGAFVLAAATGMPVVCAGLRGTRTALPLGSWLLHRAPLTLEIGPALRAPEKDPDPALTLRQAARAAILSLCGEGEGDPEPDPAQQGEVRNHDFEGGAPNAAPPAPGSPGHASASASDTDIALHPDARAPGGRGCRHGMPGKS